MGKMRTVLIGIAVACAITATAHAAQVGSVNASGGLRLRTAADTSSSTILVAPFGAEVMVSSNENGWCAVEYDGKNGFMSAQYLTLSDTAVFADESSGRITGSVVNLRADASTASAVVRQLTLDTVVTVNGLKDGWYAVKHGEHAGYVHPDYLDITEAAPSATDAQTPASSDTASETPTDTPSEVAPAVPENLSEQRTALIEYAKQCIGAKYVYGGRGPNGFDCSGFIYYVFKNFDYTLNPGASNQMDTVTAIKKSELLPGDLVFFNNGSGRRASHVGIYLGDNQFIHARSPGKPLGIDSLASGYYNKYYVGAGRVLPAE